MNENTIPEQSVLVEAIGPAMPGYGLTSEEWLVVCLHLRLLSRGGRMEKRAAMFVEDVARAADAMHNRLRSEALPLPGRSHYVYVGQEALDRALGRVDGTPDVEH